MERVNAAFHQLERVEREEWTSNLADWWVNKEREWSWFVEWKGLMEWNQLIDWMKATRQWNKSMEWRTNGLRPAARAATTNQIFFLPLREKKIGWLVDVGCFFFWKIVGYRPEASLPHTNFTSTILELFSFRAVCPSCFQSNKTGSPVQLVFL